MDPQCLLWFASGTFDAAVMALVIFFVPGPGKGIAEMVRVVRPGGMVAAYVWDMLGGGYPLDLIHVRALGLAPLVPPNPGASRIETLRDLWKGAGLNEVETRDIIVQRTFADFDDFWTTSVAAPSTSPIVAAMAPADIELVKTRLRVRLPADEGGRITYGACANAVKGCVRR